MRSWSYRSSKGSIDDQFKAVEASVGKLVRADLRRLRSQLKAAWEDQINRSLAGNTVYLKQYRDGIRIEDDAGGRIRLTVRGFDALKIEEGWGAPPDGEREDGLGEYDGTMRDMRGFMLNNATPVEGGSKTGATVYKRVNMEFAKGIDELVADARVGMMQQLFASRATAYRRAAKLQQALGKLRRGGKGLSKKWDEYLPYEHTAGGASKHMTVKPLLSRAFKSRATGKLSTIRTITDSNRQRSRRLWFTRGVKPFEILEKAKPTLIQIMIDFLKNRG